MYDYETPSEAGLRSPLLPHHRQAQVAETVHTFRDGSQLRCVSEPSGPALTPRSFVVHVEEVRRGLRCI